MRKVVLALTLCLSVAGCAPNLSKLSEPPFNINAVNQSLERSSLNTVRLYSQELADVLKTTSEKRAIALTQQQIRETLKDPKAAQFKNMRVVKFEDGKVICGELNAKNSYGAYIGFYPFVASTSNYTMYKLINRKNASAVWAINADAVNAGVIQACMQDK